MDESAEQLFNKISADCAEEETRRNEKEEEDNKLAMEGAETDQEVNRYLIYLSEAIILLVSNWFDKTDLQMKVYQHFMNFRLP